MLILVLAGAVLVGIGLFIEVGSFYVWAKGRTRGAGESGLPAVPIFFYVLGVLLLQTSGHVEFWTGLRVLGYLTLAHLCLAIAVPLLVHWLLGPPPAKVPCGRGFRRTGLASVRSDEGFRVSFLGHGQGVRYREGDYSAVLYAEILGVRSGIGIWESLERWEPPHQHETIDEQKRIQIVDRVCAGLRHLGWKPEVV